MTTSRRCEALGGFFYSNVTNKSAKTFILFGYVFLFLLIRKS